MESVDNCCIKSAVSYCGIRDKKYPDARAMGFPFDRTIANNSGSLDDFMMKEEGKDSEILTNMKCIDVKIYHDITVQS